MSRFFSPPESIKGDRIFVEGEEVRHIGRVMRLKAGDEVIIFDGTGKEYQGVIIEKRKNLAVVRISSERKLKTLEFPVLTLAQGIPGGGKMDYLIEKAAELGVNKIIPLETERTIVRMSKIKNDSARRRWEKIVLSASKQCGRVKLPVISDIKRFSEVLNEISDFDLVLFPCLRPEAGLIKAVLRKIKNPKKILFFIGPEGGFSPDEVKQVKLKCCNLVNLGQNVLKSDTAALTVLAILNYEYKEKKDFNFLPERYN